MNYQLYEIMLLFAIYSILGWIGAGIISSVHGGGFSVTIQCYIPNKMFDDYKHMIESVFGENSCVKLFVRGVGGYELKGDI